MKFSLAEQRAFARLSGDFNPIHLDPAAARLAVAGEPVVHGIHALLRVLDQQSSRVRPPATITARFERPIVLGDTVEAARTARNAVALTLDGALTLATVVVDAAKPRVESDGFSTQPPAARPSKQPRVRTIAEITGAHGTIRLGTSRAMARAFPRAARAFGTGTIAALAGISRLVGMECPGRDSLLSALSLHVDRSGLIDDLHWRVVNVDARFGLVRIEVAGGGVHGTVDAFIRPAALPSPSWEAATAAVSRGEFDGQRALILGGSRGLGAATAQLIAAGGGAALITFAAGKAAANTLRRNGQRAGHRVELARFDVVRDRSKALTDICRRFRPTHLYYFATPRIFGRRRDPFDAERFQRFADFYVVRFAEACRAAKAVVPSLDVLFPSTTSLDGEVVRELTEYAAAKAAGEALCGSLNAAISGLRIAVHRLPRAATDQTATVLPIAAADPIALMLPVLRDLHRHRAGARA